MKIGVLGGIGPEATAEFYNKLIKKLQESEKIKSNKDYPQIIINSIPAPELIREEITQEDLQPYIDGIKDLDKFGVDFIIMVCNTIHLFYDEIQKEIRTPIVDLRKEVERYLRKTHIKSILLLGTPMTTEKGLYEFDGISATKPDKKELKHISDAIFLFNKGISKKSQAHKLRKICQKYLKKDSEAVILACTELALMLENENISEISTIDIMVQVVADRFIKQKNNI